MKSPEDAQVRSHVQSPPTNLTDEVPAVGFIYPTRLVPAQRLDSLTGLVTVGGDALADSEALYDPDWA